MNGVVILPASHRVIVTPGLWKGFDVEVLLPSQGCPIRHFKVYADAIEHAKSLRRNEGWQIVDNTGDTGPEAA